MPEGDTIHGAAARLEAVLADSQVDSLRGSHRSVIEFGRRVEGTTVVACRAVGKHVLIDFSNGWTLRTHLRMTGVWHIYEPDEEWRKSPGKARVILATASHVAVCFAAPTVQLAPRHLVDEQIEHLGPDLTTGAVADEVAIARLRGAEPNRPINEVLLDQTILSGIGNVFKSEILYLEGVHPDTPLADISDERLGTLAARASRLLAANIGRNRTTTGERGPDSRMWVYGRSGRPCRRCRTPISYAERGPLHRPTYWCPHCQPPP